MASTGKKGKKNKGTVISLQSFLADGSETPAGTTQVSKKVRNYDGDDSDDGTSVPLVLQLPSAPRANRIFEDDLVPHKPPFLAYMTNLPFDANEDDIYHFFGEECVSSVRLPRDDGETGRVRGFGYVEFNTRDDLINALSMPDPSIKGRRIRIDLSNESEQQQNRQRNSRRGFDGFGSGGENRDSTNWRRDNICQEVNSMGDRGGYNRERRVDTSQISSGSWRTGNRSTVNDASPQRGNYSAGDRYRDNRSRYNDSEREWGRDADNAGEMERPKLNLKPRTLPLPEIVTYTEPEAPNSAQTIPEDVGTAGVAAKKPGGAPPANVFGAAKPVDTASRELEIEERLAQSRRDEKLKLEEERKQREETVSGKMSQMHLEKTDKEQANSAISWRNKDESVSNEKEDCGKYSPNRKEYSSDDERKDDQRINKNQEKIDKNRDKTNQAQDTIEKDDIKIKRDLKQNRAPPKIQPTEQVANTSNKYSGLDTESD